MAKQLRIKNTTLTQADRLEVAAKACFWAAGMAKAEAAEVCDIGGGMAQLKAWMPQAPDPMLIVRTLALSEAMLLMRLRAARSWAELAGAYLAPEVRAALDAFPAEEG